MWKMYHAKNKCHVKAVEQTPSSDIVLWYYRPTQIFIIGSAFHFVFNVFSSRGKCILFFFIIASHDTGYFVSLLHIMFKKEAAWKTKSISHEWMTFIWLAFVSVLTHTLVQCFCSIMIRVQFGIQHSLTHNWNRKNESLPIEIWNGMIDWDYNWSRNSVHFMPHYTMLFLFLQTPNATHLPMDVSTYCDWCTNRLNIWFF